MLCALRTIEICCGQLKFIVLHKLIYLPRKPVYVSLYLRLNSTGEIVLVDMRVRHQSSVDTYLGLARVIPHDACTSHIHVIRIGVRPPIERARTQIASLRAFLSSSTHFKHYILSTPLRPATRSRAFPLDLPGPLRFNCSWRI